MIVLKIIKIIFFKMKTQIYTDGACTGNPGPGGWAAVVISQNKKVELFGGEQLTTNNRMELTAAIKALEYCSSKKEKDINICTDSIYVKEGITKWIKNWEKNNWKTSDKKEVKNIDLWKQLQRLEKPNTVSWQWVKGHSGDPMNELADKLAKEATPI
jgi:ribonuclease HI